MSSGLSCLKVYRASFFFPFCKVHYRQGLLQSKNRMDPNNCAAIVSVGQSLESLADRGVVCKATVLPNARVATPVALQGLSDACRFGDVFLAIGKTQACVVSPLVNPASASVVHLPFLPACVTWMSGSRAVFCGGTRVAVCNISRKLKKDVAVEGDEAHVGAYCITEEIVTTFPTLKAICRCCFSDGMLYLANKEELYKCSLGDTIEEATLIGELCVADLAALPKKTGITGVVLVSEKSVFTYTENVMCRIYEHDTELTSVSASSLSDDEVLLFISTQANIYVLHIPKLRGYRKRVQYTGDHFYGGGLSKKDGTCGGYDWICKIHALMQSVLVWDGVRRSVSIVSPMQAMSKFFIKAHDVAHSLGHCPRQSSSAPASPERDSRTGRYVPVAHTQEESTGRSLADIVSSIDLFVEHLESNQDIPQALPANTRLRPKTMGNIRTTADRLHKVITFLDAADLPSSEVQGVPMGTLMNEWYHREIRSRVVMPTFHVFGLLRRFIVEDIVKSQLGVPFDLCHHSSVSYFGVKLATSRASNPCASILLCRRYRDLPLCALAKGSESSVGGSDRLIDYFRAPRLRTPHQDFAAYPTSTGPFMQYPEVAQTTPLDAFLYVEQSSDVEVGHWVVLKAAVSPGFLFARTQAYTPGGLQCLVYEFCENEEIEEAEVEVVPMRDVVLYSPFPWPHPFCEEDAGRFSTEDVYDVVAALLQSKKQ